MINKINLFFGLIKQGLPPILVTTAIMMFIQLILQIEIIKILLN